jgi:peptide chain release factor
MSEVILHLTAGQGPEECRWVVARLADAFAREAEALGSRCEVLEPYEGHPASLLLRVPATSAGTGSSASPWPPNRRE